MFGRRQRALGVNDKNRPAHLDEFVEYLQTQASVMDRSGWIKEAAQLRKWVAELREGELDAGPSEKQAARK